MTRQKKILLGLAAVLGVVLLFGMAIRKAGHAGRLTPAAVPIVADPFRAGNDALNAGDYPVALAYFLQVPKSDRSYSRAQRFIGWELYGERMGRPMAGLSYVHESLLSEPTSSNAWQDASRVYGHALKSLFMGPDPSRP